MTATRCRTPDLGCPAARAVRSAGEGEVVDETVIEVGPIRQFDVAHLFEQSGGADPLPYAQQRHLGALPRHVARADDPQHGQLGDQADAYGAGGGQVAAEGAGEQHLLDVARPDAELFEQQRPAGRDRRLGELQLPYVALRQVDGVGEYEHPLAVDLGEPAGQPGRDGRRLRLRYEPPAPVDQPRADQGGHRVDQSGAAQSDRVHVADHLQFDGTVDDAY